ncbi:hypothetical protein [Actinoplanes aureus]|uniref:Lipoprotein n=1 Tax=Actinoplanes aureus TaxID=2792083 RepID=A0A931CLN5_9ACTN|nr:hypothetical protein [Actinoplanes aureus]MBG0569301.1 hypothetical protein [Actinoplanes aureus]
MKRLACVGATLMLHAGVLAACGASSGLDCGEQRSLAVRLADDPSLSAVESSEAVGAYTSYESYPCLENSGGSMVIAEREYDLKQPLSYDGLLELGGKAASVGQWNAFAEIRPEEAGGLGDGLVCYRNVTGNVHRYLILRTGDATAATATANNPLGAREYDSFSIAVGQSNRQVDICPK